MFRQNTFFDSDISQAANAGSIIIAIGTPVDEYLNPKLDSLLNLLQNFIIS